MYCKQCYGNNAFEALDVNFCRKILVCPDCKEVSWPVPEVAELKRDLEKIKERMKGIKNMPFVEEERY